MSTNVTTFEVRVLVRMGASQYKPICYYGKAEWARDKIIKLFHIEARTHSQAREKAKKKGEILSCRKVDAYAISGNPEKIQLNQQSLYGENPYKNAVAMDEMVWNKRNNRRKNMSKDKNHH